MKELVFALQFKGAGATGLITSNFTAGSKGEVVDNHVVRLFIP